VIYADIHEVHQVGRFPFEEPVHPRNLPNAFRRSRALAPIPEGRETPSRALPSSAYVNEPQRTQPLPPQPLPPQPRYYAAPPAYPASWSAQPAAQVHTAHQPYSQPPVNSPNPPIQPYSPPPPPYQPARQYAAPPAASNNSYGEQLLASLPREELERLVREMHLQVPPQPSTSQPQPAARPLAAPVALPSHAPPSQSQPAVRATQPAATRPPQAPQSQPQASASGGTLVDSMWAPHNADATEARNARQRPAPSDGILPLADWAVPNLKEMDLFFAPLNNMGLPRYSVVLNGHKEHAVVSAYIGQGGCRIRPVEEHYKHKLRFRWYNAGPNGIWIWVELPKKFRPTRQSTVPVGAILLEQLERAHQFLQLWANQPELMNIDVVLENYLNGTYGNPAELNRNQEHQEGGNIPQGSQDLDVTTTIGAIMHGAPAADAQHQNANNQWGRRKRTGRLQHVNLDRMAAHGRWVNAVATRNQPATNAPEQPVGAAQQTAIPASAATGGLNTVVTSTNRFDSLRNEAPIPGEPGEPLEETEFPAAITQNFGDSASEDEDEGGGVGIGGEEGRGGGEGGEKGGELEN
jgi:hypothetical protein